MVLMMCFRASVSQNEPWYLMGSGMRWWVLCAVVDWNPAGVNIYCVYKYGSTRRHSAQCRLSGLTWLAARAALLHGVPNHVLQVLLPDNMRCMCRFESHVHMNLMQCGMFAGAPHDS